MALITDLGRRIIKKRQEIVSLESERAKLDRELAKAEAYIDAMEDALKLVERTNSAATTTRKRRPVDSFRKGSLPAKAFPVLRQAGQQKHVVQLLEAMGVSVTLNNKRALASSLSAYARKGEIFTRPAPNTFGLVEFADSDEAGSESKDDSTEESAEPIPVRLVG